MKTNKIQKTILVMLLVLTMISFISAAESSYCCEKTTSGAFCQNQPQANCDSSYKMAPTSCDSTSYCKPGCCFDSQEGICMENTPQRVCEASDGTWDENALCEIPQCNLGCCVLGDQGAFVTLTRCKQLSGFHGLETDFRRNIDGELACISAAQSEDSGACVYEDLETATKTCKFSLRKECNTAEEGTVTNSTENTTYTASVGFYKDILCTAEELGTTCAPSTETMMVEGKDEVYWKDTCGNRANIYDASKYNDDDYWKNVYKKEASCGAGSSNAGSASCGNCDYYLGSIASEAQRGVGYPTYGDYICKGLNCKEEGKKHGESWCETDSPTGEGQDPVGSKYYKEVCIYGEIITEPCAEYRNERCIQGTFGSFSEAACRVNRWQDCTGQLEQDDCENYDQRDCHWMPDYYFSSTQIERVTNDTNGDGVANDPTVQGLCLPNYPPGFNFWETTSTSSSGFTATSTGTFNNNSANANAAGTGAVSTGNIASADLCTMGNAKVTFKWTRETRPAAGWLNLGEVFGIDEEENWVCNNTACRTYVSAAKQKNANITEAETEAWAEDMNQICYQLGDCGGYINYIGVSTEDGYAAYLNNRRVAGSGGSEIITPTTTTTGTTGTAASGSTSGASSSGSSSSGSNTGQQLGNVASGLGQLGGAASSFGSGSVVAGTGNLIKDFIKNIAG